MHFRVTVRKLNVTDGQTGGRCYISRPGPPAPREIKISLTICRYYNYLNWRWCCIMMYIHYRHLQTTPPPLLQSQNDTYVSPVSRSRIQGSHKNVKTKFPDFSLTSNEISLTILSTTDCRAISYVNISDESRCLK